MNEPHKSRLHMLKVRGMVPADGDEVTEQLIADGLARRCGSLVTVTDMGAQTARRNAELPADAPERAALGRGYDAFMPLNAEFLDICSAWQVRPDGVPNDHDDATYDWEVRERLESVHERIVPVLGHLASVAPRFGEYAERFGQALEALDDGDRRWFASPRIESYHTVWMQLHEELRLALGVDVAGEAAQPLKAAG